MWSRTKLLPWELFSAGQLEAGESGQADVRHSQEEQTIAQTRTVAITPWGAFAGGTLAVAALAAAFSLGRHYPLATETEPLAISLSEVNRRGAIAYRDLELDRGQSTAVAGLPTRSQPK